MNSKVQEQSLSLRQTLDNIVEDPSISQNNKVNIVIHLTSICCAITAAQPIPFADIFILTPIQIVMVVYLRKVIGLTNDDQDPKEFIAYLVGVVGWGLLAQQAILGLYKTVLPFMGGLTTIPLVYIATFGLGYSAKALLEAKILGKNLSDKELKNIANKAKSNAKSDNSELNLTKAKEEYNRYKEQAKIFEEYKSEIRFLEEEYNETLTLLEKSKNNSSKTINENLELQEKIAQLENKITQNGLKKSNLFQTRFKKNYNLIIFEKNSFNDFLKLSSSDQMSVEKQMGLLQHTPEKANFRCNINGTKFKEIGYTQTGRIYVLQNGSSYLIYKIGNKNTQENDIKFLRSLNI